MSIFFLIPYPDEIVFYSVLARYRYFMDFTGIQVNRLFFGTNTHNSYSEIPNGIRNFITDWDLENNWDVNEIIDKHTFFPLYSLSLPYEKVLRLREAMKQEGTGIIHSSLGINHLSLQLPEYLRFCPSCVIEDRSVFHETYWHRIHQVAGVRVCPLHKTWLVNSTVRLRKTYSYDYVSAEEAIASIEPISVNCNEEKNRLLLRFAEECYYRLNNTIIWVNQESIKRKYIVALMFSGYANYYGKVDLKRLLTDIRNKYSGEILTDFNLEYSFLKFSWIKKIYSREMRIRSNSPIKQFIVMDFLNLKIGEFIRLPEIYNPFGIGPWNCDNPFCNNFQKPVIYECNFKVNRRDKYLIEGYFKCACGYEYKETRTTFINDKEYVQKISSSQRFGRKVVNHGPIWDKGFSLLWNDPSFSNLEIIERSNITKNQFHSNGIRLKLNIPRRNSKKETLENTDLDLEKSLEFYQKKTDEYRKKWLELLEEFPNQRISLYMKKSRSMYDWLRNNSPEWLEQHSPKRNISIPKEPNVEKLLESEKTVYIEMWKEKDEALNGEVQIAAKKIKTLEPPKRVTINSIAQEVIIFRWLRNRLDNLPLTKKALDLVVETQTDFYFRKIKWAEELFLREQIFPSITKFKKRAGVEKVKGNPIVNSAIEESLRVLNTVRW